MDTYKMVQPQDETVSYFILIEKVRISCELITIGGLHATLLMREGWAVTVVRGVGKGHLLTGAD